MLQALKQGDEGGALEKAAPGKRFYTTDPPPICPNMKLTTLEKVRDAVRDLKPEVLVDEDIRQAAYAAVERMVAIG